MRNFRLEVRIVEYFLCLTAYNPYVQVFIEYLRCAEPFCICSAQVDVRIHVETQCGTRTQNHILDFAMLVQASANKDAPSVIFPFVLTE